jgi:hypothetical protein
MKKVKRLARFVLNQAHTPVQVKLHAWDVHLGKYLLRASARIVLWENIKMKWDNLSASGAQ